MESDSEFKPIDTITMYSPVSGTRRQQPHTIDSPHRIFFGENTELVCMSDHAVDQIVVQAEFDNYDASGPMTQFEGVEFLELTLNNGEQHIWFDGKHYVADGVADTVNEGDLFYAKVPENNVWEVVDMREPDSAVVTIEIYPEDIEGSVRLDVLTSNYEMQMGDPGPPVLLKERPLR